MASPDWERILGVRFFDGAAPDAVDYITRVGGYTVVPAAPALVKIENDPAYRCAPVEADLAIADSGFMVLLWRMLRGRTIARISGLKYLRILLANPRLHVRGSIFLVLPHQSSREKALVWLGKEDFEITADDCYIAPKYFSCSHGSVSREERERVSQKRGYSIADDALVAILRTTQSETHRHWHWRGNAGQARQLLKTSIDLSTRNLLHWSCARLRHRRSSSHSDVGGSIFCRLDIPDRRPTAPLLNSLLESSFPAAFDYQVRNQDSAIADELKII
jgi:hypothetical protein